MTVCCSCISRKVFASNNTKSSQIREYCCSDNPSWCLLLLAWKFSLRETGADVESLATTSFKCFDKTSFACLSGSTLCISFRTFCDVEIVCGPKCKKLLMKRGLLAVLFTQSPQKCMTRMFGIFLCAQWRCVRVSLRAGVQMSAVAGSSLHAPNPPLVDVNEDVGETKQPRQTQLTVDWQSHAILRDQKFELAPICGNLCETDCSKFYQIFFSIKNSFRHVFSCASSCWTHPCSDLVLWVSWQNLTSVLIILPVSEYEWQR